MAVFQGFCDDDAVFAFDCPAAYRAFLRGNKGKELEVEIRERRKKRSLAQNNGFHAMVTPWAAEEGHRIEDLKRDLLREVFGVLEVENTVTGEIQTVLAKPHTSKLTVQEFCFFMEQTVVLAAENAGVILKLPDEYKEVKAALAKQAAREAKKKGLAA